MLRILRKINLFLILLIVFLVPVVFCPCLFNAFSLPKIALFRSLVLLLLFFSVFKFFLIDKKFSSPRQSAYLPRSSANKRILNFFIIDRKLLIFLVLLSLGVLISTVFSANFLSSFWGSSSRHLGLYTYLNFFLFFLLLLQNIKNWSEIKKIIWVILFSSFLVSVYAWLQYYGLDPFTWSEGPGLTGRAFGSLGQPNFLAHFLAINIPLSLYAFFYLARGKWTKVVCALVFLAQFGALLATLSRSAWLALLAGAVFALLFYLFIRKKFRILCTTTGALLIGLV